MNPEQKQAILNEIVKPLDFDNPECLYSYNPIMGGEFVAFCDGFEIGGTMKSEEQALAACNQHNREQVGKQLNWGAIAEHWYTDEEKEAAAKEIADRLEADSRDAYEQGFAHGKAEG
jgi:hypothetical protein